ncbi:MAG: hypothetical protein M1830_002721 [Pleopsidium flavum]|nr:MAG: hypothetical protein M1830_002721 [Pleopsidium flavum]
MFNDRKADVLLADPISGTANVNTSDGTIIPPYFDPAPTENYSYHGPSALDYFYTGGPRQAVNLGWQMTLEYDEYPTEIQCSACWLNRFKLGFATQWGETYNEVTAQIWANMQRNCRFSADLTVYPALNLSGPSNPNRAAVIWTAPKSCAQNLTIMQTGNQSSTCDAFALQNSIPSASLIDFNDDLFCDDLGNKPYCAPLSCSVADVNTTIGVIQLLQTTPTYSNITLTQFVAWNPSLDINNLRPGEVVCIGPPGGAYVPPATTVAPASPTVYTTTAKPIGPTPKGAIPNCGKYYEVQPGDYCNLIALNSSITFSQLINMNPSIDSNCTNLLAGYDYCVAPVNGSVNAALFEEV